MFTGGFWVVCIFVWNKVLQFWALFVSFGGAGNAGVYSDGVGALDVGDL